MTSKQKGGGVVLKFVTCLWILLFLNNRSIVHFCEWWGWGVKKLVIFCGRHKWMTPYFMLKALFFLKICEFLSYFFGYVGKQLDKKAKLLILIFKKQRQSDNEI